MKRPEHKKIIISGGGTGGHIFPALCIANAIRLIDPGSEILFVGALGRMEMDRVPEAGYRIIGLPVEGLKRRFTLKNLAVIYNFFKSMKMAARIIREFRPDVVVGVGGYASGPVLRKAGIMGIPTLIQEQNSYAGITNKMLARKAAVICVAYEGMEKYFPASRIIMTGNPVRQTLENLEDLRDEAQSFFGLKTGQAVILVLGGSLGAGSINNSLSDNLSRLGNSGCQWLWQTGRYYHDKVMSGVSSSGFENIKVHAFIDRMELAYAAADIIISRAGAGTISELCLVGKPVILVPSPNVAEDHQTSNAKALSGKNAAILIPDSQAAYLLADQALNLVADHERRRTLSANIKGMAVANADKRIAEEVLRLAGR